MSLEKENLKREISGYNTPEKRKTHHEVFTTEGIILKMLDGYPESAWSNPTETWIDPCSGLGNFSVYLIERLMEGLKDWEPNEDLRKKHILENMIYHVEMNPESVEKLQKVLNPEGKYILNVHCGDFLSFADSISSKNKLSSSPLF